MIKYLNRMLLVVPFMIIVKLWAILDFIFPDSTDGLFALVIEGILDVCEIEVDEQ